MMRLSIIAVLLCTCTIGFAQTTASDISGDWAFMFERQKDKYARRVQLRMSDGKIDGKTGNTLINGNKELSKNTN